MLVMCAFFDDMSDFSNFVYTPECVIRITVSCFFALGVNISNYLVLGMTSPLTYQVLLLLCLFLCAHKSLTPVGIVRLSIILESMEIFVAWLTFPFPHFLLCIGAGPPQDSSYLGARLRRFQRELLFVVYY